MHDMGHPSLVSGARPRTVDSPAAVAHAPRRVAHTETAQNGLKRSHRSHPRLDVAIHHPPVALRSSMERRPRPCGAHLSMITHVHTSLRSKSAPSARCGLVAESASTSPPSAAPSCHAQAHQTFIAPTLGKKGGGLNTCSPHLENATSMPSPKRARQSSGESSRRPRAHGKKGVGLHTRSPHRELELLRHSRAPSTEIVLSVGVGYVEGGEIRSSDRPCRRRPLPHHHPR